MKSNISEIIQTCEELRQLPDPVLDLTSEIQVLDSLLSTADVLKELEPELVSPVCLVILRELGRLPKNERKQWLHSVLSIAPIHDETILRALLERESFETILKWILENPRYDHKTTIKQLETLFRAIPHHDISKLLDSLRKLKGTHKDLVKAAVDTIRSKITTVIKPLCQTIKSKQAEHFIESLNIVGGGQVIPLIKQLLTKINPNNTKILELALKTVGDTRDKAFVPFFKEYLDHKDQAIRYLSVDIISGLGGTITIDLLKKQVQKNSLSIEERKHVLSSMAYIKDKLSEKIIQRFSWPVPFGLKCKELREHARQLRETKNVKNMVQ